MHVNEGFLHRSLGIARLAVTIGAAMTVGRATWAVGGHDVVHLVAAVGSGQVTRWPLDALVASIASLLLLASLAAFAVTATLCAPAVVLGRRAPRVQRICLRLTPRAARRAVALCCGIGMAAPVAMGTPALAAPGISQPCATTCAPAFSVAGLALPDLPAGPPRRPPGSDARAANRPHVIVVRRGDSLWSIAARLHPKAPLSVVSAAARDLYQHNRAVIGDDPDLILPGTPLRTAEGTR